jgi:hypothetical protein
MVSKAHRQSKQKTRARTKGKKMLKVNASPKGKEIPKGQAKV